ncbi:MAG: pitrilysin family protein [Chloroflexi bacterium]|nr:pitrilysin family protein [Chloroflexota bacterium]MDA1240419.1 pitrilysin family protein [Chloroflexota bacterium]
MTASTSPFALQVPVVRERLANGLRVVLSPDRSAPVVCVAVYYHVGMRLEPQGRTGFAHLFEHLMFQGSPSMEKMELVRLVQQNGGTLNGSTRYDYTNYFEVMPSNALELALWMEADRMRGPVITTAELDNQRDVVKNEIRVNVLNRPYGSFPWIDMQERVYSNWHNSHNGYGDMEDLDAASLEDVQAFFDTYYSPANAVLIVVGDLEPEHALGLARKYFEDIPAAPAPPPADIGEPRQEEERRFSRTDPLASRPALAVSYHLPERGTPEFYAMGLLHQLLAAGDDSLLHQELVQHRGYVGEVDASLNFLGHMHNAQTPLLWTTVVVHDDDVTADQIVDAMEGVIAPLRETPVDAESLERARTKARASLLRTASDSNYPRFGLTDLLGAFELFEGDASRVNDIDARFAAVTPELVMATAREYLRPTNRNVLMLEAGAAS